MVDIKLYRGDYMKETRHKQYDRNKLIWELMRDCVAGEDAIKSKGTRYLPKLSGQSDEEYSKYLQRAEYVNFTGTIKDIFMGNILMKKPVISEGFEEYITYVDIEQRDIIQFSQELFEDILVTGRAGVWVDWSDYYEKPIMQIVKAEDIINWHVEMGQLRFVIIKTTATEIQGFEQVENDMLIVLLLEDDVYKVQYYIYDNEAKEYILQNEIIPLMDGAEMDFIPFYFITSRGLDYKIRKPVLYDIAKINLAHYRNSADYENMIHWTGAKTIITKGLGEQVFSVGGVMDFPTDGDCYYLEAHTDNGLQEAMRHKEERIAMLGSSILSGKGRYVASAETMRLTTTAEWNKLAGITKAVSRAMSYVLTIYALWYDYTDLVSIEYNTDYETDMIDPVMLNTLLNAYNADMISYETLFNLLKKYEMYPEGWTMEEELKLINKQKEEKVKEIELGEI